MENEILYREFFIRATKGKLIDLTEDLINDPRVEDFNKLDEAESVCKTDAKTVIAWIDWVLPMIKPMIPVSDTAGMNRLRMMKVLREKLSRMYNLQTKAKDNGKE